MTANSTSPGDDTLASSKASEQTNGPILYIFDCGTINQVTSSEFGFDDGQLAPEMFTPCYLVAHPNGLLMWDTGEIPDSEIRSGQSSMPNSFSATIPLTDQLAKIGYAPADIDFLALSHYHNDHVANANLFADSTWLVQRAEREVMFSTAPDFDRTGPITPNQTHFSKLEKSNTVVIENEDYDVFGDGSVIIKFTPGHTVGHQSLLVRLRDTGPVLISGDLYHFHEEVGRPADFVNHVSNTQTTESRKKIEAFINREGAELWIPHDINHSRNLRITPEYYS